jgi:hypothetical protein
LAIPLSIHWRAALYAGVAAGIIATAAQIILWWAFGDVLPEILYRDARFAAAMVLGRGVLPPPAAFDWVAMSAATVVHFALSIIYSMVLAGLISRCGMLWALFAGAGYGLALYGLNMYGFTIIFPWFAEARDGITLAVHAVFGICAAGVYTLLAAR